MNPFKELQGTLVIKAEPSTEPPSQDWIDGCAALDEYGKKMSPILAENRRKDIEYIKKLGPFNVNLY